MRTLTQRIIIHCFYLVLGATLAGCHADVTFSIDVRPDGSALVRTREIVDEAFYRAALSQGSDGDPFKIEWMRRRGWDVRTSIDRYRNHTILIFKRVRREDIHDLANATPGLSGRSAQFGPISLIRAPGLLVDRVSLAATVPPLLSLTSPEIGTFDYGIASAFAASAVTAHLELRTPMIVTSTNGSRGADGFVRWDLGLQEPTSIFYVARAVNITHALIAVTLVFAAAVLSWIFLGARRRSA
jgi:hypothetical protein